MSIKPESVTPESSVTPETANVAEPGEQSDAGESTTRRAMLRAGAAAAGAAAVGVVAASASPASAAAGDPLRLGRSNSAGSAATGVTSSSTSPTMVVKNTGPGAGALVTSNGTNGLAAGTYGHNAAGLSVANYSDQEGRGAAVWAVGGANNGVVATSSNIQRAAIAASNSNAEDMVGIGAAIVANTQAGAAILATSTRGHEPAIIAYKYDEHGEVTGDSIHAIGGMYVLGSIVVEGDLYVSGTIYCDNVKPYPANLRTEHGEAGEGLKAKAKEQAAFAEEVTQGG